MLPPGLSLLVFGALTNALAYEWPRATSIPEGELQDAPWPTEAPRPHELLRRQYEADVLTTMYIAPDRTCGFISGLSGAAYACPDTAICVLFTASTTDWGAVACYDGDDYDYRYDCVDYSQYYYTTGLCDNGCRLDTNTLKCTESSAPYCNSLRFPDASVQDYVCDSETITSYQLAYTTYDGEVDGRPYSTTVFDLATYGASATSDDGYIASLPAFSSFSSTLGSGSATSSVDSGATVASASSSAPATTSAPAVNESNKSSTPVGAIVGGVIGGLALIILTAMATFILVRKYGSNNVSTTKFDPSFMYPTGPSEMDGGHTPAEMSPSEYYKPQGLHQSYIQSSPQQYQPVPTEIPIVRDSYYPDRQSLRPEDGLARHGSMVTGSTAADPGTAPGSPETAPLQQPAIAEVDGSPVPPHVDLGTHSGFIHDTRESDPSG